MIPTEPPFEHMLGMTSETKEGEDAMEYRLVFGSMLATVEDEVNAAMKDGWRAHGSLVYTDKYIQPMVRYTMREDDPMWTTTYAVAAEAE